MATYLHRPLRLQRRLNQIPRRALGVAFTQACRGPVWIAAGIGIASDAKTTQSHFDCVTPWFYLLALVIIILCP